jgi:hypothetical protein
MRSRDSWACNAWASADRIRAWVDARRACAGRAAVEVLGHLQRTQGTAAIGLAGTFGIGLRVALPPAWASLERAARASASAGPARPPRGRP